MGAFYWVRFKLSQRKENSQPRQPLKTLTAVRNSSDNFKYTLTVCVFNTLLLFL